MAVCDLTTARRLLGTDVLGPDEVRAAFGVAIAAPAIPYTPAELEAAAGEFLVLRIARDEQQSLTLNRLIERAPEAFDQRLLRKMGYQLKDDWGIALEPLAASDTCNVGWSLVSKQPIASTLNLTYGEQDAALARWATERRVPPTGVRRRTAVEIAYDATLFSVARGERLLADSWDWSRSCTLDGGYVNIGGFTDAGMQILAFSPAVRHGGLGVCPVRLPST
ncbi:MAG TPA: hypothetical protein VMW17_02375 [Candidatus Binatia bacterium]|nr:hypothetical protein [Candidatus Binatia bacterium]